MSVNAEKHGHMVKTILFNGEPLQEVIAANAEEGWARVMRARYQGAIVPLDGMRIKHGDEGTPLAPGMHWADEVGEATLSGKVEIIWNEGAAPNP